VCSVSASNVKPKSYFSSNFSCFSGVSGEMPSTTAFNFFRSGSASRSAHDCVVQPGVSAFG
jgi:hypothetical protein